MERERKKSTSRNKGRKCFFQDLAQWGLVPSSNIPRGREWGMKEQLSSSLVLTVLDREEHKHRHSLLFSYELRWRWTVATKSKNQYLNNALQGWRKIDWNNFQKYKYATSVMISRNRTIKTSPNLRGISQYRIFNG